MQKIGLKVWLSDRGFLSAGYFGSPCLQIVLSSELLILAIRVCPKKQFGMMGGWEVFAVRKFDAYTRGMQKLKNCTNGVAIQGVVNVLKENLLCHLCFLIWLHTPWIILLKCCIIIDSGVGQRGTAIFEYRDFLYGLRVGVRVRERKKKNPRFVRDQRETEREK